MNTLMSEAIPTASSSAFAEAFQIERAVVGGGVVFAGDVEGVSYFCLFDDLRCCVEFGGLGGLSDVSGVKHEFCCRSLRVDLVDSEPQGSGDILICGFVEADMAVADLNKAKRTGVFCRSVCVLSHGGGEELRLWNSAPQGPEKTSAGPGHAAEKVAAVDTVRTG